MKKEFKELLKDNNLEHTIPFFESLKPEEAKYVAKGLIFAFDNFGVALDETKLLSINFYLNNHENE